MPIVDLLAKEDLSGIVPLWEVSIGEYRYVFYSGHRAEVYKPGSSSPTYTITDDGCSCKAAQYGNTNCKHRVPVKFVGAGPAPTVGSTGPVSKQTRDDADPEYQHVTNINDLL